MATTNGDSMDNDRTDTVGATPGARASEYEYGCAESAPCIVSHGKLFYLRRLRVKSIGDRVSVTTCVGDQTVAEVCLEQEQVRHLAKVLREWSE